MRQERLFGLSQKDRKMYSSALKDFLDSNHFNELVVGLDHAAWKAKDAIQYARMIEEAQKRSVKIVQTVLNGRRISIATFYSPLQIGSHRTNQLEIMEPKPGTKGSGKLDHVELLARDFGAVVQKGAELGVDVNDNGHHKTVAFIMENGQEVKFTDRPISQVISTQLALQTSRVIWLR